MRSLLVPLFLLLPAVLLAQTIVLHPGATSNQADYVVITASRYLAPVQQLTAYRSTHSGYTTAVVVIDSIYSSFGRGTTADSAVRLFIRFALTSWQDPKPQLFLLAGNINVIPSHKEPGIGPVSAPLEDSVCVDRWFVEDVPGPGSTIGAAIGRFPAWSVSELESMVTKTIQYETAEARSWAARSLAAADYHEDDGTLFEDNTHSLQAILSPQWPDTLTVYVRPGTLYSRDRTEFRNLWNQGAAVITLMGHMNWAKFTHESYFTTWEVDSLADNTPLAFCLLTAGQRYERPDSIPIAVNLLRAPTKGAIATLAPSGLTYVGDHQGFVEEFARQAVKNTGRPIGIALLSAINSIHPESFWDERNETLLGDPALVLKHRTLAGTTTTTGSVPEVSMLLQNYPNPFNPSTTIEYSVAEVRGHLPAGQAGASGVSRVRLTVYDVLGREVAVLVDGQQAPGRYSVMFDGSNLTTGVYLCRLQAGNTTVSKKLMLAR